MSWGVGLSCSSGFESWLALQGRVLVEAPREHPVSPGLGAAGGALWPVSPPGGSRRESETAFERGHGYAVSAAHHGRGVSAMGQAWQEG